MFKFKTGYSQAHVDDVQHIFGIPTPKKQASQSARDTKNPKWGKTNLLTSTSNVKTISKENISDAIEVTFAAGIKEGNEEATYLIILYLLFIMLLGSSIATLPWSFVKSCNSITNIN